MSEWTETLASYLTHTVHCIHSSPVPFIYGQLLLFFFFFTFCLRSNQMNRNKEDFVRITAVAWCGSYDMFLAFIRRTVEIKEKNTRAPNSKCVNKIIAVLHRTSYKYTRESHFMNFGFALQNYRWARQRGGEGEGYSFLFIEMPFIHILNMHKHHINITP